MRPFEAVGCTSQGHCWAHSSDSAASLRRTSRAHSNPSAAPCKKCWAHASVFLSSSPASYGPLRSRLQSPKKNYVGPFRVIVLKFKWARSRHSAALSQWAHMGFTDLIGKNACGFHRVLRTMYATLCADYCKSRKARVRKKYDSVNFHPNTRKHKKALSKRA